MKKKTGIILLLMTVCAALLAGCGGKTGKESDGGFTGGSGTGSSASGSGIEGTWVLTEEIQPDGKKISSKELKKEGISETYEITGTVVRYVCEVPGVEKPIEVYFELEETGENQYNIVLNGGLVFASSEVKGDTLTNKVESDEGYTTMIYKRQ